MSDPAFEALWKHVVNHWEEEASHGAFLEHCQRTDQLAEAAARYRGMTGDRDRGPLARKRLQGVTILALAKLEASRTPRRQIKKLAAHVVLLVLFSAVLLAILVHSALL